jgi:hypothetical protein
MGISETVPRFFAADSSNAIFWKKRANKKTLLHFIKNT